MNSKLTKDTSVIWYCSEHLPLQLNNVINKLGVEHIKNLVLINPPHPLNLEDSNTQINISVKNLEGDKSIIENFNDLVKEVDTDYIVLLKDFIDLSEDYISSMKLTLENFPDTLVVSPKILSNEGLLLGAGSNFFSNGNLNHFGHNLSENKHSYKFNFVRDIQFNSFCSLFFKKDLFEQYGYSNKSFSSLESALCDTQLSANGKILYQPKAEIIISKDTLEKLVGNLNNDLDLIKSSHKDVISNGVNEGKHRREYTGFNEEKEHLLIFEYQMIAPDKDAGSLRTFNIIKLLQENYHVTMVLKYQNFVPKEDFDKYYDYLSQNKVRVVINRDLKEVDLEKFLVRASEEVKKVLICRPDIGVIFHTLIKSSLSPDTKIIFDTVDIHHLRFETEKKVTEENIYIKGSEKKKRVKILNNLYYNYKALEWFFYHDSDEVWAVTVDEEKYILDYMNVPKKKIKLCPIIFETKLTPKSYEERKDMMFIGSFWHRPNVLALEYYINEIIPELEKRKLDIKLHVVGSHPEVVEHLNHPMLIKHGFVENVEPFFNDSLISFQPLLNGAGMKGKITQSLAWGLPIVTTSIGAQGYVNADEYMIIGNSTKELVDGIETYLNNKSTWDKNRTIGIKYIEDNLSFKAIRESLKDSLLYSDTVR